MSTPTRKIVCVCAGGNVRSVGTARILKYGFNQNAVAVSYEKNMPEPFGMLAKWADFITIAQPYMITTIPKEFHEKVRVIDVGPDVYGNPDHPELQKAVLAAFNKAKFLEDLTK